MAIYTIKFYVELKEKKEFFDNEKINYRKIYHIPNVIKDQLVAEIIKEGDENLEEESEFLYNTYKEAISIFSDDFYISQDDRNKIFAKISGKIYDKDGKFYITDKLEIENVDFSTGNIFFVGDLFIKNEIKSGFEVKAKNIFVNGNINNSKVAAGEKVITKGGIIGIQGTKNCYIKADKMVVANFVENSIIECKGTIYIKKSCMHSDIYSGEKIIVEEPGYIVGGNILAKQNIMANIVGSKWGTYTLLKVGIDPFKYLRLKEILQKKEKKEELYENVNKSLVYLNEVLEEGKGTEEEREELKKEIEDINKKRIQLLNNLERLNNLIEKLKKEIEEDNTKSELKGGKIFIFKKVFPGVEVKVGLDSLKIKDELNGKLMFYFEKGKINFKELKD